MSKSNEKTTNTPRSRRQVFTGTFIHSKNLTELEILHNTYVYVDEYGVIVRITSSDLEGREGREGMQEDMKELGWDREDVEYTHIHAPQYPNSGLFGSSTLLNWLNTYTFPLESSLSSLPKANTIYSRIIQRTLSHGTTTAAYYATLHVAATNLLADLCLHHGQRALIGRCCMDSSSGANPPYYRDENAQQSLQRTMDCISHCEKIDPDRALITAILTPRFAPSCTRELMLSLGKLSHEKNLPIQTHISENRAEVSWVRELFPECADTGYAGVYDAYGCLTPRTILAHAVHVSEGEVRLIRERGSGIAHCPVSNSALRSGMAGVRGWLDGGVKVGLGTDVSGGFSASVLVAAREASCVSRCVAAGVGGVDGEGSGGGSGGRKGEERDALSVEEVLYLATRGGAEVVGMQEVIGGFEVGMQWDAQLVGLGKPLMRKNDDGDGGWEDNITEDNIKEEVGAEDVVGAEETGPVDIFGWETWEEKIAKWVFNGDDRNTLKVWVKGRLVHQRRGGVAL
ncbi:guanine deaminase [Sclerotinia borealis F-4128]|uniref:Probable guanine deaminase n=1 Tax=Sclerotinia borealis (strain F-4128) TaxID=1432307 RepID=W9CBR0_SCLBF|nr:guanine deaminase [Sclerotinia borealis F-4128]